MTDDTRPWTYQEAADWFNRDVVTIRRWVREGKLERLEVNGLITAESVRRLSTLPAQRSEDYHAPRGTGEGTGDDRPHRGESRGTEALAGRRHDAGRTSRLADGAQRPRGRAHPRAARGGPRDGAGLAWNPATAVELPEADDDKADPLTLEEARALLAATRTDRLGPLWRLALVTGLRQGELLGLGWDDVADDTVTVRAQLQRRDGAWSLTAPKAARKVQRIAIDPDTAAMLDAHRIRMAQERTPSWQYHGLVFPTPDGQPYQRRQVLREFHAACDKAEMAHDDKAPEGEHTAKCVFVRRRRFHDLRGTSATLLRDQGVTEDTRMARLGHNTTDMARHYAKASEAQDRAAAAGLGRALGGAG